jgi:hypothetical protein
MTPRTSNQGGQGLTESLLVLGALVALLFGLHSSATLRQFTLVALQESTLAVFIGRSDAKVVDSSIADVNHQRDTENELLGVSSGTFLRATDIRRTPATSVGQFYLSPEITTAVQRHSYLYSGDGRSRSSQSIHLNIGNSTTFWRNSADGSLGLAKQVIERTKYIDAAWRRARPQLDWLGAWKDLVPRKPVW